MQKMLKVVNFGSTSAAIAILIGFWLYFTVQAFAMDFWTGLRSVAASLLPVLVSLYITFFTELAAPPNQVPLFNVFFIASVWTLLLFLMIELANSPTFPIAELGLSVTSALMLLSYRRVSPQGFLSYAYGIVVGFLIYIILLGGTVR